MLLAAGLVIQATPVLADNHDGEGHGKKGKMFEKYDANGDGMISESEFLVKAKEKFAKKDANGDGVISKDEAKEARKNKRDHMKDKWKEKREKRKEVRELESAE